MKRRRQPVAPQGSRCSEGPRGALRFRNVTSLTSFPGLSAGSWGRVWPRCPGKDRHVEPLLELDVAGETDPVKEVDVEAVQQRKEDVLPAVVHSEPVVREGPRKCPPSRGRFSNRVTAARPRVGAGGRPKCRPGRHRLRLCADRRPPSAAPLANAIAATAVFSAEDEG